MRSLHYPITLADSFDMRTIEQRVRDRAHAFEGLPGLAMKAFLVTAVAQGAARNLYAPFYVWQSDAALRGFLCGPLFDAVIRSFGLPSVFDAPVLEFAIASPGLTPHVATIETIPLDRRRAIADAHRAESDAHRDALGRTGLFAASAVLHTAARTVQRLRLWRGADDASHVSDDAQRLKVLKVVCNVAALPDGS